MYDKCYFCLDQLPKLKKESTASFFVSFGGAGVQKSRPTLLYLVFLATFKQPRVPPILFLLPLRSSKVLILTWLVHSSWDSLSHLVHSSQLYSPSPGPLCPSYCPHCPHCPWWWCLRLPCRWWWVSQAGSPSSLSQPLTWVPSFSWFQATRAPSLSLSLPSLLVVAFHILVTRLIIWKYQKWKLSIFIMDMQNMKSNRGEADRNEWLLVRATWWLDGMKTRFYKRETNYPAERHSIWRLCE